MSFGLRPELEMRVTGTRVVVEMGQAEPPCEVTGTVHTHTRLGVLVKLDGGAGYVIDGHDCRIVRRAVSR